ncbi:transcriptional regulator, TetR family [Mesobacillus persicus]|uniref:Transcriptional regulator, TetR family n=1 Tax=Mesobacillus persicus TaxID=930146 RepID=A0A1H7Z041_9BACI|nr:TetR/AcrR family transcriptional regulator [Mesobacillus persicus]SEM51364.1 transcriptional regulator, TetR family [Mesobacillus persicus]
MSRKDTREMILETATRLFQRQGYNGTGVNQIIEESGTPKGSLYYHFPKGKEEIALEAIRLVKQRVLEQTRHALLSSDDVIEAFQQHVNNIANFYDSEDSIEWLKVGLLASETAFTHETLRCACEKTFQDWQALYAETLEQHGYEQTAAKELGITINVLLEGATTVSLTRKSGDTLRVVAKQIPTILCKKTTGGRTNES